MFEAFYGLREDPFRLSSDHRFCYPHRNYARARAYVDYALHRAEGFVMVTGSPGTGKTTLINELLSTLPERSTRAATLLSTRLEAEDLLRMTAYALGLEARTQPKAMLLQQLMEFMNEQYRRGGRTLLIIDEAQDLGTSALEELRLLTNLHQAGQPLLQIVLVGQEPLRELVRRPDMEQLHQRLIAAWHLQPLDPAETMAYVRHRLETAGWQGDPGFDPGVLEAVYRFSHGVPRRINLICSRLLLHGCILELHRLTRDDALNLVRELGEEELAPDHVNPDQLPEVDWAEIDRGLDWTPPPASVSVSGAASPETLNEAGLVGTAEPASEFSTAVPEYAQPVSDLVEDPQIVRSPPEQSAAPARSSAPVPAAARLEPIYRVENADADVPEPLFAVEHSEALLTSGNGSARSAPPSIWSSAEPVAPSSRIEPPARLRTRPRRIKRRSAGILGLILFILMSLVPAGMLMVLAMVALPAAISCSGMGAVSLVQQLML